MKNKTISVKDILNEEHLKSKKIRKEIDFKAIDMSNEKDISGLIIGENNEEKGRVTSFVKKRFILWV